MGCGGNIMKIWRNFSQDYIFTYLHKTFTKFKYLKYKIKYKISSEHLNRFSPIAATPVLHQYRENACFYLHNQSNGQTPEPPGNQRISSLTKRKIYVTRASQAEIFIHEFLSIQKSKADISASGTESLNLEHISTKPSRVKWGYRRWCHLRSY